LNGKTDELFLSSIFQKALTYLPWCNAGKCTNGL